MAASPFDFLAAEHLLRRSVSEPFDLYQSILEAARRLAPLDAFYLCRIDRASEMLQFVYVGEDDLYGPGDALPFGNGPTSRVAKTGQPVILEDDASRSAYRMNPFGNAESHSGSALHWPLWIDAAPEELPDGALSVQSQAAGAYGPESRAAVEWLTLRVAAALATYDRRERTR